MRKTCSGCRVEKDPSEFHEDPCRIYSPFAPSLDRIEPAIGYVPENVRLVCTLINIAMNQFGEDTFRLVAEAYLKHRHR